MAKSIGILSLKGGVGKTSTVVSLGAAMADLNKKVLLIDGNLSAPNLGMHFNIVEPEVSLHDVLNNSVHPKDAIHEFENLDIIPSSMFSNIRVNPLKLRDKIKLLRGRYDAIIIDSSPALNEETLGAMLASDSILIATTPDYPTLSTTLKAAKIARNRGSQIDGLIINKVHNKNFELSSKDIENTTDIPIMAVIPHDVDVLKAQSQGIPYTRLKPYSEGSVEYKKLAAALIGEKYKPKGLKHYFKKLIPKREEINRSIYYNSVFK